MQSSSAASDTTRYHNPSGAGIQQRGFLEHVRIAWKMLRKNTRDTVPNGSIPVHELDSIAILRAPDNSIWRFGHSTMLLKLNGQLLLTDPVFSDYASPLQFLGPKRFHVPPAAISALPQIDAVLISHNHYDHLDKRSVQQLRGKADRFIVPAGLKQQLVQWGIPATAITELQWYEETRFNGVRIVATPARHYSGRSLWDRNRSLWASYCMISPHARVFFSGDSGYFDGFREIGERYGPFDLTLIEAGGYNQMWHDVHMAPAETLQAHLDLRGKFLMPVHNSTFDLSEHVWWEPMEQLLKLAELRGVRISFPQIGEMQDITEPSPGHAWWNSERVHRRQSAAAATQPSRIQNA